MCTMKIYGDVLSGNCQKVRFVADHLRLPYTWVPVDTLKGESRTPDYLAKFPQGQVPAIEAGNGRFLAQSNAIMSANDPKRTSGPLQRYSSVK